MRAGLWLALLLVGCAGDEGKTVDTSSTEPALTVCDEVDGPVTWDNFGAGFTAQYCQGCHHSARLGEERQGAPEDVVFDTEEATLALRQDILDLATGDVVVMPPQGGVPEEERLLLEVWLTCW